MNGRTAARRCVVVRMALATSVTSIAAQSGARFNPPKHYYLALGDSLAFGFQFVKFNANFRTARRRQSISPIRAG